jgi:hypothetical protein
LVPPPWTGGQALWHSESVVHEPQVPPPLLEELLLPLSSSPPLLLPEELVLLPEEELVLPEELVLLPEEELVLLPPSLEGAPLSPKSNPLEESP